MRKLFFLHKKTYILISTFNLKFLPIILKVTMATTPDSNRISKNVSISTLYQNSCSPTEANLPAEIGRAHV